MADVIGAAGLLTQADIPFDGTPFGLGADTFVTVFSGVCAVVDISAEEQAVILTVRGDELVVFLCFDHRPAHHLLLLHASAVVGESGAFVGQPRDITELFALFADRDRGIRENVDDGVPVDDVLFCFQMLDRVGNRGEVRHRTDGGISASCRCLGTAFYRLFIRKSRLSEMDVNVTEAGKNRISIKIGERNSVPEKFFHRGRKRGCILYELDFVQSHYNSS